MSWDEVIYLDIDHGEPDVDGETAASMWRLHRKLAVGGGWEAVLEALTEASSRWAAIEEVHCCAALIWEGEGEFFHRVVGPEDCRDVDDSRCAMPSHLATLFARERQIELALRERGQVVLRRRNQGEINLFLPVAHGDFLGAFYVAGLALGRVETADLQRAVYLFGPPAVELIERYRVDRALRDYQEENRYFRDRERRHYLFKDLVCESEKMSQVYDQLHDRVEDDAPLWMTGEAGTGKELLARALHHLGNRQEGMLIRMDCADFPPELVDFELFGCVASELTGAVAPRKGIFELAEGGTVFLDEIDRLSLVVQGKLVRVLKEKEVRRMGDVVGRPVDARFIASSHRDLEALCDEGRFRRDLFELLRPNSMHVPSLRQRPEDVLPLARIFLQKFVDRYDACCQSMDEELEAWLDSYPWPGNVRQLQTFMEAAVLMARERDMICREDLSLEDDSQSAQGEDA